MSDDLYGRVCRLLAQALRVDPAAIRPASSLVTDLGAKSIDIIEVILALEEEFQVELPDCDISPEPFDLTAEMTVQDLTDLLRRHTR